MTAILAVLTVKQPWAWAIVEGLRLIETRSCRPPAEVIGEYIGIHVAKTTDHAGHSELALGGIKEPTVLLYQPQHIIGAVKVRGWADQDGNGVGYVDHVELERWFSRVGRRFAWFLEGAVRFEPGVGPCRGRLGLWDPGVRITNQIESRLGAFLHARESGDPLCECGCPQSAHCCELTPARCVICEATGCVGGFREAKAA